MSVNVLDPIQPDELLADRAYRELSRAIITGRIEPGTRLSVPELARQLDISRSPVREAVQRLIYDGLAENRGRRGAVVAQIDPRDFLSLLEVRQLLEGFAARKAAVNPTDDDVKALRKVVAEHRRQIEEGEIGETTHVEFDQAFHSILRDMAANEDLTAILGRMQGRAHLSFATLWREPFRPEHALAEHEAILEAVASRDPEAAAAAACAHIDAVRQRYADGLDETGPAGAAEAEPSS
jgi:DNA-binding GntR family transcriptional regulator